MSQTSNQHHEGAWKVAYADFVTAMMALWSCGSPRKAKRTESRWLSSSRTHTIPLSIVPWGVLPEEGTSKSDTEGEKKGKAKISDLKVLMNMAQAFMDLLNVDSSDPEKSIDLEVTADGLRVTLYDRDAHPFFVENTADYTDWGKFVLEQMSWLVHRHFFKVRIDGYVSDGFRGRGPDYSAWELPSDRANSTRRLLEYYGVDGEQFQGVSAFGDTQPLPFMHPSADANDQISISLVLSETFNTLEIDNEPESVFK